MDTGGGAGDTLRGEMRNDHTHPTAKHKKKKNRLPKYFRRLGGAF